MENEIPLIKRGGNMECPNCSAVMKLVMAGVSKKSGKPYNAFYSCPECKETVNPEATPTPKSTVRPPQKQNGDGYLEGKKENNRLICRSDLMGKVVEAFGKIGAINSEEIITIFKTLWAEVEK